MSNLIFVNGDFRSGSTLLFTLFRKTGEYHCLYEPLHERMLEYLIWPLKVDGHHFFVKNYFSEYKNFRKMSKLLKPEWGVSGLHLPPEAESDDLYRYLFYIIGAAFGCRSKVMLQFNRATFRLGWLKAKFPQAKIVHIYRDQQSQWNSIVRMVQEYIGGKNVGEEDVMFNGFNIATWCEDLKNTFPSLDAKKFRTGYERFCKLWELSYTENRRYADISVDYWTLTHDFEMTLKQIGKCIGYNFDIGTLKQFVIPPEKQNRLSVCQSGFKKHSLYLIDKVGRKYAKVRLQAQKFFHESQ